MKDYADMTLAELAIDMRNTRQEHAEHKEETTAIWRRYENLAQKVIPARMEEMGITKITLKDVGSLSLQDKLFASVPKENKFHLQSWLEGNGYGDLVVGTVNSSTLSGQVRKWIKDGDDYPEDLITLNSYELAVLK